MRKDSAPLLQSESVLNDGGNNYERTHGEARRRTQLQMHSRFKSAFEIPIHAVDA